MDLFFLQLIVIFIPGLLWERVDSKYGADRANQQWDILRRAFVFGLIAYLVTYCFLWLVSLKYEGWAFKLFDFRKDVTFLDASAFWQIALASAISLICAVLWLYASKYKIVTRLLHVIHASKRYGDEDVWDYMFNSGRPEVEYLHLRDFEKELTYAGWVEAWSESERQREVVLKDVVVYDFEGRELFRTARVYLARKADNVDIEFPYQPEALGSGE
jgi:hypothetical protein